MSFSKRSNSRLHLLVLSLCVAGCFVVAIWPGDDLQSQTDAAILMRAMQVHSLSAPAEPSDQASR